MYEINCDEAPVYEIVDSLYHKTTGRIQRHWFCSDCQTYFEEEAQGETITARHDFDSDGFCLTCGYKGECTHENHYIVGEFAEEGWVSQWDESGHTLADAMQYTCYACNDCGATWWETARVEEMSEPHSFNRGVCRCGYEIDCAHPELEVEISYVLIDADSYENAGEQGHYVEGIEVKTCTCDLCGVYWTEMSDERQRVLLPHELHGGACACGMTVDCDHANVEIDEIVTRDRARFQPLSAEEHSCICLASGYYRCADCGERLNRFMELEIQETEPHEFVDGKCIWCNYVQPAPTPTPTPTPMPAPTDEAARDLKLGDALEMAETLLEAAAELERAGASVEIVNAEKVLTAEEKQALDALPAREQLMVFISVIGFEEQANAAMERSGMQLSERALRLKETIQNRIAAMTQTERADFEAALLENFSQEVIEIDGEEYVYLIIELEIREGDTVRYERYGFRRKSEA